jgi:hypothetical protein
LVKRTRYQYGTVEIHKRVNGPDVWLYRWWESTSDGRRTRRGFTVGTVDQYKTEAHALKAAEGMRLIINDGVAQRPPVPFSGLLDRFLLDQKQELPLRQGDAMGVAGCSAQSHGTGRSERHQQTEKAPVYRTHGESSTSSFSRIEQWF